MCGGVLGCCVPFCMNLEMGKMGIVMEIVLMIGLFAMRIGNGETECDLYTGKWELDSSYPLFYNSSQCPFIRKEFDCIKYGRPDRLYLHFRWHPFHCHLPRFSLSLSLSLYNFKFIGGIFVITTFPLLYCKNRYTIIIIFYFFFFENRLTFYLVHNGMNELGLKLELLFFSFLSSG